MALAACLALFFGYFAQPVLKTAFNAFDTLVLKERYVCKPAFHRTPQGCFYGPKAVKKKHAIAFPLCLLSPLHPGINLREIPSFIV